MTIQDLTDDQQFHSFALIRCRTHKAIDNALMLHHFTIRILIESVARSSNERRADLVQLCTGMKRNSALKLSIDASIAMIETALAAGDTSPDEIFDEASNGITTEEIVRYFPLDRVFELWINSGFIATETKDDKAFMADLYDFINQRKMFGEMTALQLVQELGLRYFVSDKCPIEKRVKLLETVLNFGEPMLAKARPDASSANAAKAKPFTAANLLETITPTDLVDFVPLGHMSKPIFALAKAKGWIKPELPKEALDSEAPPAGGSSDADDPEVVTQSDGDASVLAAETDALLEGDAKGEEEQVVVVDDDEATTVADRSGLTVPKPPPLSKKDRQKARAGS
ncbi:MAG TPA: hypothetical protein VMU11_04000 [Verrucomicrobiae bacterium]|nr:hypothetical protein [Verrucomicrobiae bacterium]